MLDKQRLTTFVLGGIAGALAGIFLAPKSGRELRGSIASRAGEARERSRETYFEAQERMQERMAESRERPPRSREGAHPEQVGAPLPGLGPTAAPPETILGAETPDAAPEEVPRSATPPLRDVSWDVSRPEPREEPDPEEVRRKIRETRSLLRARLDRPQSGDAPRDRDDV